MNDKAIFSDMNTRTKTQYDVRPLREILRELGDEYVYYVGARTTKSWLGPASGAIEWIRSYDREPARRVGNVIEMRHLDDWLPEFEVLKR